MSDLISRQQVLEAFEKERDWLIRNNMLGAEHILVHHAINVIDNIPTERKTGKWEQVEVNYLADMDAEIKESMAIASMYCPACKRYHNEVYLYGNPTYGVNFCPNCGADMRGGDAK